MDLLDTLMDAGKKMASDALMQQAGAKSEQGADTFLSIILETFNGMDATQKTELLQLFKTVSSQVTGDGTGLDGVWSQVKESPLVRQWAGQLAQEAVKRLSTQFLS